MHNSFFFNVLLTAVVYTLTKIFENNQVLFYFPTCLNPLTVTFLNFSKSNTPN